MNTTTTTCCPTTVLPTRPLPLLRWSRDLRDAARAAVQAYRDRARRRAEWRSLQGLSDATLRDIGLADRQMDPPYTLGVLDHERGRWS